MSRLPIPNPNGSIVSLTSPFARMSLRTMKDAFSAVCTMKDFINHTETHAAVLVRLCDLNDNPGLLLEVRGKLGTHSGEFLVFFRRFSPMPVKFHVDRIEIPGRLDPPTRSPSSLRVWPYVMNLKYYSRAFPSNDFGGGVSARKTVRISPRYRWRIATTSASLVVPDIIQSRGRRCPPSPSIVSQTLVMSKGTSSANPPLIWCATLQTSWRPGLNGPILVQILRMRSAEDEVDGWKFWG